MSQNFLFIDEPRTLVEDVEGGIRHGPRAIDEPSCRDPRERVPYWRGHARPLNCVIVEAAL